MAVAKKMRLRYIRFENDKLDEIGESHVKSNDLRSREHQITKRFTPLDNLHIHTINLHSHENGYKNLIILQIYIKNGHRGFFYINTKQLYSVINIARS